MEIDYVVDKKGNKYQTKTYLNFGATLSTAILPELRPIDAMGIQADGYIFCKWIDPEFRSVKVNEGRYVGFAEAIQQKILLDGVDKLYTYIHPSNKSASKWAALITGRNPDDFDEKIEIEGVMFNKIYIPVEHILETAEKIKAKWKEKS